MKKAIKILTIILTIVLVGMVGFLGIYVQKQNRMENIVKDYDYAMDLKGARIIAIKPEEDKETIIKDAQGNEIEEDLTDEEIQEKGYTKEEVDKNAEKLTLENFKKTKEIMIKRLEQLELNDYNIALDEQTGEIKIEIEENNSTNSIISDLYTTGNFEISDSETEEVLLDNQYIKEAKIGYISETNGTSVCLQIELNSEGKAKLEEITNTYKTIEESEESEESEEGNTTEGTSETSETSEESKQKEITMKINDQTIMTTSFDEPIRTGTLQLTVGSASSDVKTINEYSEKALSYATILNNGKLPMDYEISGNEFIYSEITNQEILYVMLGIAVISAIALIYLIIKYKLHGLLASFSFIGFASILLLLIRYANVAISLGTVFAGVIALAVDYLILIKILKKKEKSEFVRFFFKTIPITICSIIFCFMDWIPIASFGMTLFWGVILMLVYNYLVTTPLLSILEEKNREDMKNEKNK